VISQISSPASPAATEVTASPKVAASRQTFSQALTEASSTSGSQVSAASSDSGQFFGGWTATATTHAPKPTPFDPQPSAASTPAAATTAPTTPSAANTPFVPQFESGVEVVSAMGGSWPLNPDYFATQQTAQYIANQFGTGQVIQVPYGGNGGPYAATSEEYDVVLQNGATVNAGLLADYYVRMPESQCPGLADTMIQQAIATAEQYNG
jgi:hypothetical protein